MKQKNTGLIVKSKLTEKFTIIPNEILTDRNLSLKGKGLLCILLSLPNDWAVYKTQLCTFSKDGRDATIKAFDELVENGYITSVKRIDSKGRFMGWDYVVYNERINPIPENPKWDNPKQENQSLQSTKEQSTKEQSNNTNILGKTKSELISNICKGLNITNKQLNYFVENGFNEYWHQDIYIQYKELVDQYLLIK
jgi:hypothetical protein